MNLKQIHYVMFISFVAVIISFAIVDPVGGEEGQLSDKRYDDPKGYFKIVPPKDWKVQEYPQDIRGKAAFLSQDTKADLRILVNSVDFSTMDELMEFCQSTEKRLGVTMKIEKFDFYGRPAVRRSFELQGKRFLMIDFLIGKADHNLQFCSTTDKYDQYLPMILKSMETYEPVFREISEKESVEHITAKKLRLGQLMAEVGRFDLALEYVREGLALAPDNNDLLNLQKEVNAQFRKDTEQDAPKPAQTHRYKSDKFGFSFDVPEKINIYTADNPGPMAARISAETPMWIVNSDVPNERINVKIMEGTTMPDIKNMTDISNYSVIPNYERISFKEIKIGKEQNKAAFEHIHLLKQNPPKKLRQILFVHKGNGFGFTCSTSIDRFDTANEKFFEIIFSSMDFNDMPN